ncbi:anhydro-N-acetylmuramic acid kinase [Kerstersia sp.]|uniref:anhydro-N-acetylmuramic acid kinase n=1 Tax=Kerstersia sp. TaxID=1930783 RepID=UPI003F929326
MTASYPDARARRGRSYIGIMSGTSLDGIDAVQVEITGPQQLRMIAHAHQPYPASLREELLALNQPGDNEIHRAETAALQIAQAYAQAVAAVLYLSESDAADIAAIGAHGQTVRHRPDIGYTVQLNAPALLAELTGIPVVADFRRRDIAAGGQGAPLVPVFHSALFQADHPRALLNLGGIGNLTLLRPGCDPQGFDTGPGNMLLDLWCQRHTGQAYDAGGTWAASGHCQADWLAYLQQSEPWLALPPPKSTGRDLFNSDWLDCRLPAAGQASPADIQATLSQFTVATVLDALNQHAPGIEELIVCGGGARNLHLLGTLAQQAPCPVNASDAYGVDPQHMEAMAFAWLAWAHHHQVPAGLPSVTGARHRSILGAWHPA